MSRAGRPAQGAVTHDNRLRNEYPGPPNSYHQQQPIMSQRTHQSTFREENVPVTDRSPIKSARYQLPTMMMHQMQENQSSFQNTSGTFPQYQ